MTHYEGRMQKLGRRLDRVIQVKLGILTLTMNNFSIAFTTRMNATRDLRNVRQELPVSGDQIAKMLRG